MIPKEPAAQLGFSLSEHQMLGSFIHHCQWFEHNQIQNLYLTDWDLVQGKPAREDILFFVYNNKTVCRWVKMPRHLLTDKKYADIVLNNFISTLKEYIHETN